MGERLKIGFAEGKNGDKPKRYFSCKQETDVAKSLGGHRVPNSGATKFSKGDVAVDEWLIEAKTKILPSESITVRKDWFLGIEEERAQMLKSYAAVCFSFGDGKNYYAMDEKTFKFLLALSRGE